jgi:hypothetical protein
MSSIPRLEPTQEELLFAVVEASRRVSKQDRQKFYAIDGFEGMGLQHPGLGADAIPVYRGDIETLGRLGLLFVSERQKDVLSFDVSPHGYDVYGELKRRSGQPVERMESTVRSYLNAEQFTTRYPMAYKKWSEAESLLWHSGTDRQLTLIGHLLRESMQDFADTVIQRSGGNQGESGKADTVRRIRAVLNESIHLGKTEGPFMAALLAYWGTVSDLVQRQEHGGQKEGEPLDWEDARRVVLHTAVVMFEIDRVLTRRRSGAV